MTDDTTFIPEPEFATLSSYADFGTLRPGDRVLVRLGGPGPTADYVTVAQEILTKNFPGVTFTVIVADEILVYRADDNG